MCEGVSPTTVENLEFLNNEARKKMLFMRDRGLDRQHKPYGPLELLKQFQPYLTKMNHVNLSPREVRLIETVIDVWAEILELRTRSELAEGWAEGLKKHASINQVQWEAYITEIKRLRKALGEIAGEEFEAQKHSLFFIRIAKKALGL